MLEADFFFLFATWTISVTNFQNLWHFDKYDYDYILEKLQYFSSCQTFFFLEKDHFFIQLKI